jgi:lipid-A-disaccharide synthase-like uncharacterized protein
LQEIEQALCKMPAGLPIPSKTLFTTKNHHPMKKHLIFTVASWLLQFILFGLAFVIVFFYSLCYNRKNPNKAFWSLGLIFCSAFV